MKSVILNGIQNLFSFGIFLMCGGIFLFHPSIIQFFGTLDFFTDSCGWGFMSKNFGYYINLYCGG